LEIVKHFANTNISHDDLYFYDEFRQQYASADAIEEIALVDHNLLDMDQSFMESKVTRVIDHHVDSGAYAD
jgi:inorganic pyrophosphatase/exopolyphosphatase